MNLKEAIAIKNLNQHLIGKTWKGQSIDRIIVHPKDQEKMNEFVKLLSPDRNEELIASQFAYTEMQVSVIYNKRRWEIQNECLYHSLEDLAKRANELDVVLTAPKTST